MCARTQQERERLYGQHRLEDTMARFVDIDWELDVAIAHARTIGHPKILAALYGIRRSLKPVQTYLADEWTRTDKERRSQ